MDRFDKDISFLESVDRDPILKELCRQYSVYSFDEKFRVITFPISDLIKRNYEAGYFLSNYPYVLSLYGVRDDQMDNLSVEELPYLATLACLTWHFRRDYFCQGELTYRSIAEGTLLRLFCHLRELYKKEPNGLHFGRTPSDKVQCASMSTRRLSRDGSGKAAHFLY